MVAGVLNERKSIVQPTRVWVTGNIERQSLVTAPVRPLWVVDSTGERNTLRRMEECLHEAKTSDLLLRQPEDTESRQSRQVQDVATTLKQTVSI
jgi:hypothetical protein